MSNCNTGSCSTSQALATMVVTHKKVPRPAFMAQHILGKRYPAGSSVFTSDGFYFNPIEETMDICDPRSSWRQLDMLTIWLKLQRLSACTTDFIFPEIKTQVNGLGCDEAARAEIWHPKTVGSRNGTLWTPKSSTVPVAVGATFNKADWCGGYTASEVMAYILKKMCAEDAGNLG